MKKLILAIIPFVILVSMAFAQTSLPITIDLEKNTTYVTAIGSNEFLFSFSYQATGDTNLELEVILPEESVVVDRDGLLISRPVDISTDGRRISLIWLASIKAGDGFSAFVQYEGKPIETSTATIAFIIFVIGAAGVFAGYRLNQFRKEKFIDNVTSEDENKVVQEIKKKGEILQEDLRYSLNWSKTKISKIVRNLESKNIVVKTPYKKTNKLKIK